MLNETNLDTSTKSEDALMAFDQNDKDQAKDFIAHHGIKGQKWGVRRYQNADGSLTEQGRQRYGDSRKSITRKNLTKGQARFAKDALASLDQTPRSKNEAAFKDTLKQLGKAAEESGVMDPNDSLSPYKLSRSPDQSRLFDQIYENMPTVGHNTDKYYKKLASEHTKNADGYRKEKMDHLDEVIDEFHPDLYKELGTKQGKDTRNFIVDAVKGFNEGDPDMVTYQHMDEIIDLSMDGYIDKKTFEKLYDGQAAEDAVDWLGYGLDSEEIKRYNGWYKDLHHSDTAKDFIAHHGIKGQKWGRRRYQNSDGSLTAEGRKRYGVGTALDSVKKAGSAAGKAIAKAARKAVGRQTDAELDAELAKAAYKHDRQMKKDTIQALSGKRKRLDKMTDAEVDAYLDRLAKEKSVRNAERDLKRMNRSDFSNFMHDLKNKSYEGLAEGAKQGLKDYTSARIKQVGAHRMDMKDRKWNEKHENDHLTETERLQKASNISKMKYDIAKNNSDRRKILSGKDDDDNHDKAAKKSQNKFNIVKNDLERRALEGDKDAMDRLREYTKAKSKPKNDNGGEKSSGNNNSDSNSDKKKKTKRNSRNTSEWINNNSRKALPPARS